MIKAQIKFLNLYDKSLYTKFPNRLVEDYNIAQFIYSINSGEFTKDSEFCNVLENCLGKGDKFANALNNMSLFWDVYNSALLLLDNLSAVNIDKITNAYLVTAAALLAYNDPKERKEEYSILIYRLMDLDYSFFSAVIEYCEECGKFFSFLIYSLNICENAIHRITLARTLNYEKYRNTLYEIISESEVNKIDSNAIGDICYTVVDCWERIIDNSTKNKSYYGTLYFSIYSNFILKCMLTVYSNNHCEYLNCMEKLLNDFDYYSNDWFKANESFVGQYFAFITHFHFMKLINDELHIIDSESKIYNDIKHFLSQQYKYRHFWEHSTYTPNSYLSFDA